MPSDRTNSGVSDLTYVSPWKGWVYVAFVVDVSSRRIVGLHQSSSMHTEFVLDALEQALYDRKPHRGDRKWVNGWSLEQIANRLKVDFLEDQSMRISHEAIYQALCIQGRGALKRELVSYRHSGRALRVPRARAQATAWAHVNEEVMISSRPAEVEDRAVPSHWEWRLNHRFG